MEILLEVKCTVVSENKKVIDGKVQVKLKGRKRCENDQKG